MAEINNMLENAKKEEIINDDDIKSSKNSVTKESS